LDSEYYKKEFLDNEQYLSGQKILNYCSDEKMKDVKSLRLNKPFNYIAISNVSLKSLSYTYEQVNPNEIPDRATYVLKENDIAISTVRPNRNAVTIIKDSRRLVGTSGFSIIRADASKINPYFLFAFCKTKYFVTKLMRENTASMYPAVTDFDIWNIKVPLFSKEFQSVIERITLGSLSILNESKLLYGQAELILLESSGLIHYKPPKVTDNNKTLKETLLANNRLDAEFYEKKYDVLESLIVHTKHGERLGKLLTMITRGIQPIYTDPGKGIQVLNSKHIRENRIEFFDNRWGDPSETTPELIIRKNDVLLNGTGVGTIGRSAVYLNDEPALPDNHVTILRTEGIDPVFLSVQLNSIIGKMQVDKFYKGSSGQIELYPTDIEQFMIWNGPNNLQRQIRQKIEHAERLRKQSEALLLIIKEAMEIAILKNENAAIKFIKQNDL
jgi:type I restriction enzyme M protein